MQSTDLRKLHHLPELRRLHSPRDWSILVERQVSSRPLVVFEIQLQDATQPSFIQDDDVVQALAANRAEHAIDLWNLPVRLRSRAHFATAPPRAPFVGWLHIPLPP